MEIIIVKTSADELKKAVYKNPEKKAELEQLANSLNEKDNPVLMMVRSKEQLDFEYAWYSVKSLLFIKKT